MLKKARLLWKAYAFVPLLLFFLLLLLGGIIAITQESSDDESIQSDLPDDFPPDDFLPDELAYDLPEETEEEYLPSWIPPGPARWFRSNAGGMALEEIPSRLAAIRNRYALVADYLSPDELDSLLFYYYRDNFTIEIRVLFEDGEESRRQWMFRDDEGMVRLNAVLRYQEASEAGIVFADDGEILYTDEPDMEAPAAVENSSEPVLVGFIEIYQEDARLAEEHLFLEDGAEMMTAYFYNEGVLVSAETRRKSPDDEYHEFRLVHTDHYRYTPSFALRHVERVFYETSGMDAIRQVFPYMVLHDAVSMQFLDEKLPIVPDFFGDHLLEAGSRIVFETDSRGRVLTQTMVDNDEEVVWVITNVWLDDRIYSIQRAEGDDVKLTEYEYNSSGERIVQRDINNGVLERQIRIDGINEIEELFMDGVVVLRAYWEDGRKIREERVRR